MRHQDRSLRYGPRIGAGPRAVQFEANFIQTPVYSQLWAVVPRAGTAPRRSAVSRWRNSSPVAAKSAHSGSYMRKHAAEFETGPVVGQFSRRLRVGLQLAAPRLKKPMGFRQYIFGGGYSSTSFSQMGGAGVWEVLPSMTRTGAVSHVLADHMGK